MNFIDLLFANLFLSGMIYSFYTFLTIPISTFLLAYVVPKSIITKYLRQPYFNDGDDELFEHMPFRQMLTFQIAIYTASKWFAGRRKIQALRQDSPTYWRILAWVYFWSICLPPIAAFILSILGACYFEITGRPVPQIS